MQRRMRSGGRATTLSFLATALVVCVAPGHARAGLPEAGGSAPEAGWSAGVGRMWFSLGALGGSTQPSAHLADYQWDTSPRMAWGAQALAGRGRLAGGLRLWRTQTTQTVDLLGASASPTVRLTSFELVGRGRLAAFGGSQLDAVASAGRVHLGYQPDQVAIASGGSGSPIIVAFSPIDEWTGSAGVAFMRTVAAKWNLGVGIDYGRFGLDTAHRNGAVIETTRESFGQWNARFEVARLFDRR